MRHNKREFLTDDTGNLKEGVIHTSIDPFTERGYFISFVISGVSDKAMRLSSFVEDDDTRIQIMSVLAKIENHAKSLRDELTKLKFEDRY